MHQAILPALSTASVSAGMWYVFQDGPNTIRAWGSGWGGLERIYYNDQQLADCRHIKRLEYFVFTKEGHEYRLNCSNTNLQKWQVHCSFWKDGIKLCALRCRRRKIFNIRPTIVHLGAGVIVGLMGGLLKMPAWFGLIFIFISLSITLLTTAKTQDFIIEQDMDNP